MNWDSEERRSFTRAKFPCEISISDSKKDIISAHTEDISAGGIRAIVKEKLGLNSIIELCIHGIEKTPIVCQGRVRWIFKKKHSFSSGGFLYDTGIEFCRMKKKDIAAIKRFVVSRISEETKGNPKKLS
ncbi:MAG: PilZ domain-containing protein [Candidatus Omnitrophica bacterium]|nr:PilZ domain-containing protein [Candidatus Omnitrophota bacterium]MBU4479719.1 PilZ domain-containing protein [Candidatus Omnitrophota bacterium]MCG2703224.1 PilZ domain-containing protein [Candidatus Omnitrophota bacterium]